MATSPTQRTLALLRKEGYTAQVVEKWIPQTKRRLDLFGGIDIVAVALGVTLGVQATSASNLSARVTKLCAEPKLRAWLEAGNKLEAWGWSKKGSRGKRKTWQVSKREITLAEMEAA